MAAGVCTAVPVSIPVNRKPVSMSTNSRGVALVAHYACMRRGWGSWGCGLKTREQACTKTKRPAQIRLPMQSHEDNRVAHTHIQNPRTDPDVVKETHALFCIACLGFCVEAGRGTACERDRWAVVVSPCIALGANGEGHGVRCHMHAATDMSYTHIIVF